MTRVSIQKVCETLKGEDVFVGGECYKIAKKKKSDSYHNRGWFSFLLKMDFKGWVKRVFKNNETVL